MIKFPKVSIIIPLYIKTPYFFESVEKCLELDYPDFEILIGVDRKTKYSNPDRRVKILKTGEQRTGPAEKRDIGIVRTTSDYIAFLDDDSYPEVDWLKNALKILKQKKVSAVCGPGLTPPADSFTQQITGAILSSWFGSGPYRYRFTKDLPRYVDDYPAYNMIVDRKTLLKVGKFGTKFYGGEDTALCIKLINAGEKIYYHPDIVVYHHRRNFPQGYLKQVGNVGLHRGYFVKRYPQTSLRLSYFMPSVGVIGSWLVVLLFIFVPQTILTMLIMALILYTAGVVDSLRSNSLLTSLVLPFCVYLAHVIYAINFLKGLIFVSDLKR